MKKLLFLVALMPLISTAGLFRFVTYSGTNEMKLAIEAEVNKNLPSADTQSQYFSGMSEANSMSAAGVTTSYGTVFNKFLVGATVSGGAHLGSKSFTDFGDLGKNPEKLRGFGAQAAIIAGVNVGNVFGFDNGLFDVKKLKVYLSGFALDKKFGQANVKYFGMGLGAQYRFFEEKALLARSIKWTGVDFGTGLLFSNLKVDASIDLNKTYDATANGTAVSATLSNSSALINAKVNTFSVPLEASTGLRLFYFFKLIAGLGVDLNFGKTTGSGSLSPGSTVAVSNGDMGTGEFSINGSDGPKFLNLRAFGGPQIEFGVGTIFATIHKSLLENAVAVNAGVNFFW